MRSSRSPRRVIRYGSDCSGGVDAPAVALQRIAKKYDFDVQHVFASDINADARQVLCANHEIEQIYEDVADRHEQPPYVDVYCAGFPCQPFSYLGDKGGLEDTRGTVFFECMRYVRKRRPAVVIFENVLGIMSIDKGRAFRTILSSLERAKYRVSHKVLNACDFGVPQHRRRVFIVGVRGRGPRLNLHHPRPPPCPPLDAIRTPGLPREAPRTARQRDMLRHFHAVTKGDFGERVVNLQCSASFITQGHRGLCPCIVTKCSNYYHAGWERYFTPDELARLMGLRDGEFDGGAVSTNKRLKIIGNSIVVGVAEHVMDRAALWLAARAADTRRGHRILQRAARRERRAGRERRRRRR